MSSPAPAARSAASNESLPDVGVAVEVTTARGAESFERVHVRLRVDALDLLPRGGPRLSACTASLQPGGCDAGEHGLQTGGSLRMPRARVVLQVSRMGRVEQGHTAEATEPPAGEHREPSDDSVQATVVVRPVLSSVANIVSASDPPSCC